MSGYVQELLLEHAIRSGQIRPKLGLGAGLYSAVDTFAQQREFILAEDRRITLCTPRRAAKSEALIRKRLLAITQKSRIRCVYASMTREVAKKNVWDRLLHLNERYQLGLVVNHSDLTLKCPRTESEYWITGLATKKEIGKLRGNKYDSFDLDETQDILIDLEDLLFSVVYPALGDERGQLCMAGTPDPFRRQPIWYLAVNSDLPRWRRWRRMGWKLTDNRFFRDPETYLLEVRESEGYSEDDPRYQAEYLGLWTTSKTNLCIDGYDHERNGLGGGPLDFLKASPEYQYLLGLDPAYKDSTAFVVAAYSPIKRHIVFPESWAKKNMIVSDMAAEIQGLMLRWPISQIACDEAKMGKTVAMELTQRYNLPVVAADKKDKRMRLAFMNSDLRTGRLQVIRSGNSDLIEQWQSVLWDRDHQREAEGQVCDLFDAAGYAHMACRSFWDEEPVVKRPQEDLYWERKMAEASLKKAESEEPYDYTREFT